MQAGSDEPLIPHDTTTPQSSFLTRIKDYNWRSSKAKRLFMVRAAIIMLLVITAFANSMTGMMLPYKDVECLTDATFEATAGITEFLRQNLIYRDAIIVFASGLMDVVMLISAVRFLLLAKTWRPITSLLVFYVVRGIIMVAVT